MKCYKTFGRVRAIFPTRGLDMRQGVEIQFDGMPNYITLGTAKKLLENLKKGIEHAERGNPAASLNEGGVDDSYN